MTVAVPRIAIAVLLCLPLGQAIAQKGVPYGTSKPSPQAGYSDRVSGFASLAVSDSAINASWSPGSPTSLRVNQQAVSSARALKDAAASHTMRMLVTAYCPCKTCCGPDARGITASGATVKANGGRFVAADPRLFDFGDKVSVPGYHGGMAVPVLDTGGDIKGRRLDVYFPTHAQAKRWGARWVTVEVH